MTCPGNRHSANCIGTLSLPIKSVVSCQDDVKMSVWQVAISLDSTVNCHLDPCSPCGMIAALWGEAKRIHS